MKKILVLLLALCLISSLCLIAGCGEKNPDEGKTSKSVVVSDESTSSFSRPSRVTTRSEQPGTSTNTSKPPVFSTEYSAGGETSTSVPGVVPSGESLIIPESPIPSGISTNAKIMMMTINGIKSVSPTNFREKKDLLDSIDTEYAKLTAAEKQEVANYNHFLAAKEKYNELEGKAILIEWENAVTALPSPDTLKNANVDAVYNAYDMYSKHKTTLQNGLTNFATLETTLMNCYNKVQASIVEMTYIAQDAKSVADPKTTSSTKGDGIIDAYELSTTKTRQDSGDGFFTRSQTGGSSSSAVTYSDIKNPSPVSLVRMAKGEISFNAPCSGTVTYIAKMDNKTYSLYLNNEKLTSITSASGANTLTYKLPSGGAVKVSRDDNPGESAFYAIKFSYPNLG